MSEVDYGELVEARTGPAERSPMKDEDWVKANIDSIDYPSEAYLYADDLEISKFQARLQGILDTSNTVDDHTVGDPSLCTNSFTHTLNLTQTIDLTQAMLPFQPMPTEPDVLPTLEDQKLEFPISAH